ncbi:RAD24 Rf-C activator 1 AAA+ ATpase [Cryptosporidium bovis]|uniref:RAD24 Rf-C activator 1 AAA+ ATpase n=1 Tax=Cryptosporidium bovis TaxID=310047 RepID=UPI00351A7C1C|nr:RAD24 Rf-C activator 1 AAA+ ATpase [Cryptosporidium bovis]
MSLWTKEYEPSTAQELVVNKAKILEISGFLTDAFNIGNNEANKRNILIIYGPNGCGKTTLLRCLCKKMDINVLEWETPFGLKEGLGTSFLRFITNSTFFPTFHTESKGLVLIKEFPNTLVQHNRQILDEIRQFLSSYNQRLECKVPIVFISTESKADRSFLKLILPGNFDILEEKPKSKIKYNLNVKIKLVKLNPIPSTVLRAKLKQILKQKNIYIGISEDYLVEQVCHASNGDLSHAINLLQLLFIEHHKIQTTRNIVGGCIPSNSYISKKKRCKEFSNDIYETYLSENNYFVFGKEQTYNIFRTIGKILYNKRDQTDNSGFIERFDKFNKRYKSDEPTEVYPMNSNSGSEEKHDNLRICYYRGFEDYGKFFIDSLKDKKKLISRGKISFDLESVLTHSGNDEETLILFLQENYIPFIGNSVDVIECSEIFSWSDNILRMLPNNEEHLHLLVLSCISRTILYFNSSPINPCSASHKVQTDEKIGFTNNLFSKSSSLNSSIYVGNDENYSKAYSSKSTFRWHPKKPFYKTFVSDSRSIKEEFQIAIGDTIHFNAYLNTTNYSSFSKVLFIDIFPYLNCIFLQGNNKPNNSSPYFNNKFLSLVRSSIRYTKYISSSRDTLLDEFNIHSSKNLDTAIGEYLSDEQLVSILETCEADIYNLFESKAQNTCDLNITNRYNFESIVSSDDSIDDNF